MKNIKEILGKVVAVAVIVAFFWSLGWKSNKYILMIVGSLLAVWLVVTGLQRIWKRRVLKQLGDWLERAPTGFDDVELPELLGKIENGDLKDRPRLFPLLDEVGDRYLAGDDTSRERIREFFAEQHSRYQSLMKYAHLSAHKLRGRQAERTAVLQRGLAAVSINNQRTDWRECLDALRDLFSAALDSELDPAEHFEDVADKSSQISPYPEVGDHPSTGQFFREALEQFKESSGAHPG